MTLHGKQWMAVYTKPRSEKKVAERLDTLGIEIYCPLQTTIRQWSDRKKKVLVPIFPSYVFVHIEEQDRLHVLQDPGVMNFVFWMGKPAIIKDEEVSAIKAFHNNEHTGQFEVCTYKPGDHVDITAGVFSGTGGLVVEQYAGNISLLIESLGMIVKITVNSKYVN